MSDEELRNYEATHDAIVNCKAAQDAVERFHSLLDSIKNKSSNELSNFITISASAITQDSVTVIVARQLCTELITFINSITENATAVDCLQLLLQRMLNRNISFEAQIVELREVLATRYETMGDVRTAAETLAGIPLDNGQRVYSPQQKVGIYLRIAEHYINLGEPSEAEPYVNRTSLIMPECKDDDLLIRFKSCYARLLDFKQKFLEAGQRYAELSVRFPNLEEPVRLAYLERALTAALIANANQGRARLLASLYKDERCQSLASYSLLESMHMGRLISRSRLRSLQPLLTKYYPHLASSHQQSNLMDVADTMSVDMPINKSTSSSPAKAKGDTNLKETATTAATSSYWQLGSQLGRSILERAIVEHNMLAASLSYENISLKNLGDLLEVSTEEAENIARRMISEGRLCGQIDQIDSVIYFESDRDSVLQSRCSQIESLCLSLNRVVEDIETKHPDWANAHMAARIARENQLTQQEPSAA